MLEVWKMRGCTCCAAWARHFEAAGFGTTIHELDDLAPVRAEAGVPDDLGGCHTMNIEDPDAFNRAVLDFITWVDAGRWWERNPETLAGGIIAGKPKG